MAGMTIYEFDLVLSLGNRRVVVDKYYQDPCTRWVAYIEVVDAEPAGGELFWSGRDSPLFVGHTPLAAWKKLKDWYHYEGRKNGNH